MKLAAQLYTIRDFTRTPEDIHASLKKIKDIGYDTIQMSGFGPIDPVLLKSYLEELGLELCVTHTPLNRILEDTDAVIAEHKLWNCSYVGLGAMPNEYRGGKEAYDAFLKAILPAAEKIREAGLKFVYHNHRFEFACVAPDVTGIEYMASQTDPETFGFLADLFWVQAGGASPVKFLETYGNRIDIVHFKDMKIENDAMDFAEIFCGNMDYSAIYETCKKQDVAYAAIEQDTCPGDPFDSLKISFDNLKAKGMFL